MPLLSGKDNVGRNITQLKSDGYSNPKQRVAIALSVARRGKAEGGPVMSDAAPENPISGAQYAQASGPYLISIQGGGKYSVVDQRTGQVRYTGSLDGARQAQAQLMSGRAMGGRVGVASGGTPPIPFYARSGARALEHAGMVHSPTGGRADKVPASVGHGSYVLPADTLSGVGGGNSANGAAAFNKLFKMGPYGATTPHPSGGGGMKMPTAGMMKGRKGFADGGDVPSVPVVVSGGEFVIPPEKVMEIGGGDLDHGHQILDKMVMHIRKQTKQKLGKLPKPEKS